MEITIHSVNCNCRRTFSIGTRLKKIAKEMNISLEYPILGALVNNHVRNLHYEVFKNRTVRFIDITHPEGMRMYERSLSFLLYVAAKKVRPEQHIKIIQPVSCGHYYELEGSTIPSEQYISSVKAEMKRLVKHKAEIDFALAFSSDALSFFKQEGLLSASKLFALQGKFNVPVNSLLQHHNYYYGTMLDNISYLTTWDIIPENKGFILQMPYHKNPQKVRPYVRQKKFFDILSEHKKWTEILGLRDIASLNEAAKHGKGGEMIKISEALHEKKIANIAQTISEREQPVKLVFIAGPSSSGKTTFSKRLAIQLKVNGLFPFSISMDDFFLDKQDTPVDKKGEQDFESISAIDTQLFHETMENLMNEQEVYLPRFHFSRGKRVVDKQPTRLPSNAIIIVEGIHGLNPIITEKFSSHSFKVFVSALTQITIDEHSLMPSVENRLVRRIIRDFYFRGTSAEETISRWESVRLGEEKNIFPFQESADVFFNSATLYELAVFKRRLYSLLRDIPEQSAHFPEANHLQNLLGYFAPIPDREIPPTSIVREFIGGSSFVY